MVAKSCEKSKQYFYCESCHYNTSRKSSYDKHLNTHKHQNRTNLNGEKLRNDYICEYCNKVYKVRNSLWYHKNKCKLNTDLQHEHKNIGDIKELKNLIIEVIKNNGDLQKQNCQLQEQNSELQKQNQSFQEKVLDVYKNIQPNVTNNHTNSHNKTFNLQFFLNEQCKDAMNITEFINSVSLSIHDLEKVGSLGYVEGISSIIINELRSLDIYKRPMHCSDTKRETLYIKDEDKWEKESQENKKIKNVIKSVEHKNIKMINEWTKENSEYKASHDKDNDKYLNIVLEAAGGTGNYEEKGNKIIKKIAKEIAIDK
jgi:hypothetical protein